MRMAHALGFTTLRKHIKVEPDRYYYNADLMGMLIWQDMPSMYWVSTLSKPCMLLHVPAGRSPGTRQAESLHNITSMAGTLRHVMQRCMILKSSRSSMKAVTPVPVTC